MNILMIGAHPDDCEIEGSGLAAKYASDGHNVQMLSICNGCGGHHKMAPADIAARRAKEIQTAAKVIGVKYDVWDIPDCELVADLKTRKRLVRYIRKVKPDIIFSHRTNDYHADHRNAALLVQDASYLLIVPNFCYDAPALPKMPVIMHFYDKFQNPPFNADIVVSVDDVMDKKYAMLDCHTSQMYEWLPFTYGTLNEVPSDEKERLSWLKGTEITPDTPDELIIKGDGLKGRNPRFAFVAAKFRKNLIERYGEKGKDVVFAEAFSVSEYGSPLTEEAKKLFFPY